MPFYEYQCPSCQQVTEVMQKISDAPLKKCPACGKSGIKRLISAPVFRLKGSGWYETDFKSDKEGKRNLAGRDAEESKPATSESQSGDKASDKAADKAGSKAETQSESKGDGKGATEKPADSKPSAPATAESSGSGGKADSGKSRASKPAASKRTAAKSVARKPAARRRAR